MLLTKEVSQWQYIFRAFGERGLASLKLSDTVVQILPKTSLLYSQLHILVGSRQYPYIGFKFFAAAHWTIHSFLQYPEQQCLHFWRHVSDLVKEERTALGRLNIPCSILFCIGKRPLHVAEELRCGKFPPDTTSVHRHKRLVLTPAMLLDQLCDRFFPATVRSKDHDGTIQRSHTTSYPLGLPDRPAKPFH